MAERVEGGVVMSEGAHLNDCLVEYFQARMAAMTEARRRIGIGELDARAVMYLVDHPGIRPSALRDHLGVTSAAVTILVDRLVVRGALRREPDPDDRRASRVWTAVDLDSPPWNELTRFDREVTAAADRLPDRQVAATLTAVDALVAAAGSRQD